MDYFRKMKVYDKVPIQRSRDPTGNPPDRVRWVYTNKQDELNRKYRSRLVAKGFKRWADPATATPPIEMLRFLASFAVLGWSRAGRRRKLMVNVVARAYSNALGLMPTVVETCEDETKTGDEVMCGELGVDVWHKMADVQRRAP